MQTVLRVSINVCSLGYSATTAVAPRSAIRYDNDTEVHSVRTYDTACYLVLYLNAHSRTSGQATSQRLVVGLVLRHSLEIAALAVRQLDELSNMIRLVRVRAGVSRAGTVSAPRTHEALVELQHLDEIRSEALGVVSHARERGALVDAYRDAAFLFVSAFLSYVCPEPVLANAIGSYRENDAHHPDQANVLSSVSFRTGLLKLKVAGAQGVEHVRQLLQEDRCFFWSVSYVCPEPVLAK